MKLEITISKLTTQTILLIIVLYGIQLLTNDDILVNSLPGIIGMYLMLVAGVILENWFGQ